MALQYQIKNEQSPACSVKVYHLLGTCIAELNYIFNNAAREKVENDFML